MGSVAPIRSAIADILFYRTELRDWRKPDGTEVSSTSESGRAVVHVFQGDHGGYQIFALRICDEKILVNQQLYGNFHYKVATPVFHQWKNEQKQVIGLSFQNPDDAISFSRTVKEIVESLPSQQPQQQYQQIINGNVSNGVYQDPQTLYQQNHRQQPQQQHPNNNKDLDQESIGSGHSAAGMTNYRQQQQKSSYSSLQNGHPSSLNQQQQRRCSQGSSGSGSTPSSSNIYQATTPITSSNYGQANGHSNGVPVVKAPVPPPPPPPQQLNGSSSNSNNGTSSNVAQVSKNAPPPPPPPPPGGLSLSSGGSSLADQLKNATLRKSSAPVNRASSDVSQQQQQPQPKTSVAGAQNLMSELAAKLGSRNTGKTCNADNVSTSSSSGVSTASSSIGISPAENCSTDSSGATMVGTTKKASAEVPSTPSAPKPWSKPNGVAGITAAAANMGTLDSPKGQRKVINASNSVEASSSSSITVADLEQFKQEILNEVNKTKEEISEIRQDISKLVNTQQEIFETLRAVLNQR